ncbi:uncharacterized protein LOC104859308 [Fukomys damarensis]|uniref:uncharacterized protein LOC104859308 n=1 Tax=Fukomys damarensis TaxID=885580 RepID=UPI00053F7D1A|nr:uncharacterized protein LOC104859308 [Fukomys damarensis]
MSSKFHTEEDTQSSFFSPCLVHLLGYCQKVTQSTTDTDSSSEVVPQPGTVFGPREIFLGVQPGKESPFTGCVYVCARPSLKSCFRAQLEVLGARGPGGGSRSGRTGALALVLKVEAVPLERPRSTPDHLQRKFPQPLWPPALGESLPLLPSPLQVRNTCRSVLPGRRPFSLGTFCFSTPSLIQHHKPTELKDTQKQQFGKRQAEFNCERGLHPCCYTRQSSFTARYEHTAVSEVSGLAGSEYSRA